MNDETPTSPVIETSGGTLEVDVLDGIFISVTAQMRHGRFLSLTNDRSDSIEAKTHVVHPAWVSRSSCKGYRVGQGTDALTSGNVTVDFRPSI